MNCWTLKVEFCCAHPLPKSLLLGRTIEKIKSKKVSVVLQFRSQVNSLICASRRLAKLELLPANPSENQSANWGVRLLWLLLHTKDPKEFGQQGCKMFGLYKDCTSNLEVSIWCPTLSGFAIQSRATPSFARCPEDTRIKRNTPPPFHSPLCCDRAFLVG